MLMASASAIVIGLLLLILGATLFITGSNIVSQYLTTLGQIGYTLSSSAKAEYQRGVNQQIFGGIVGLIGFVLVIGGAVMGNGSEPVYYEEGPAEYGVEKISDKSTKRQEILTILDKLDKRLIEGNISEETYKELKTEYKQKLRLIEREDFEEDVGIHKKG